MTRILHALLAVLVASALPSLGEFSAYNDIASGPATGANTTTYAPNATASGPMKDSVTGVDTAVTLTVATVRVRYESTTGVPAAATDAGATFLGYVDFSTAHPHSLALNGNDTFTYSFSGLDPTSEYEFAGTACRGQSTYTNRWTLITITGADSFTAAHSSGVGIITSGLAANQVALWTGDNSQSDQGFIAQWIEIDPGADGTFSVVSSQYTGSTGTVGSGTANGSKGYGLNGIRLKESFVLGQPTIENRPATDVGTTSARMSGEVIDPGSSTPLVTLYYGEADAGAVTGNWDQSASLGPQSGSFGPVIGNLNPATTYYFRYNAQNSTAARWASPSETFTTLALPPIIDNLPPANVLAFSAELGAEVTSSGGIPPTVTIFYGTSDGGTTPGTWDQSVDLGILTGTATMSVTGLLSNTTYHVRARAVNSGGTVWAGSSFSFTTLQVTLASIENEPAMGVTGISAVLHGTVTDTGGDPPLVRLYFGRTDAGASGTGWESFVDIGLQTGSYTRFVGNLVPESTCYFRALASNTMGRAWAPTSSSFATPTYTPPTLVINEIHYDEGDKTVRGEFIEIHNLNTEPVGMTGWTLTGAVNFTFPPNTTIEAGSYLVIAENPDTMQSRFGFAGALGPWSGKLRNRGETLNLRSFGEAVVSRVDYRLGFPWPTVGDPVGRPATSPSIQLINPLLETDLGGSWRSGPPTPGAPNSVFDTEAPPQTRQVAHTPKQPTSGEAVVVTALVTDPDGVNAVSLSYQVVNPGDYYCRYLKFSSNGSANSDSRYENPANWTTVAMADDGLGEDLFAGDGVYTATLPGTLQTNRRLVRYRISVTDTVSNSVTVPYADDPQPNFAYFVYDGTPDWTGVIRPGNRPVTYPGALMSSIPTYFLLSKSSWVDDSQFGGYGGSEYLWPGTMVYDGEVYDHIQYRPRGGGGRFQYGKNFWKFDFHRGRRFQAKDEYGRDYNTEWSKLNFSSIVQQVNFGHRGEQGLFEGVGFRLFELCGVEAPKTHHVQFYVIDNASPTGANQYTGDYYGLFLVVEQMDGQFLDEHDLPDGNLYKIEGHSGRSNNQGPTQVTNNSDVSSFISGYRNGSPTAQWWRANLDIDKYLSYRTVVEGIHHYDIAGGKNYFYYHNPETDKFELLPWDLDLTWANNMYGNGNHNFKSRVANNAAFNTDYQNRLREIKDLLYNSDEGFRLIDETVKNVWTPGQPSLVGADRRLWDNNPRLNHKDRYYDISSTGDFEGMIQILKNYIVSRGSWMTSNILTQESQAPSKPVLAYNGAPGFPTNDLLFSCSAYNSPGGSSFAAMEWRVAEVHNPTVPGYDPAKPYVYEIENPYQSGELTTFRASYHFPAVSVRVNRTYRTRVRFKDAAGRWGHWSNTLEFTATTPDLLDYLQNLRVSEFMYHPPEPTGNEVLISTNRDQFEFVELKNVGPIALDLRDVRFTKGIDFDFAGSAIEILPPGEFVLIVKSLAAFETRYGTGLPVAGEYPDDNLENSGERLKLSFGAGTPIHDIDEYEDSAPWPVPADGSGFSLCLLDVDQVVSPDHDNPANWRMSRYTGGSPGADDILRYSDWKIVNGVTDDNADDDNDGLTTLMEFFLGGDPAVFSPERLPHGSIQTINVGGVNRDYLTLTFQRQIAADGTSHEVEFSTDLVNWTSDGVLVNQAVSGNDDGFVTETWRAPLSTSADARLFARLRVQD
jgi:hypothetical protein